MQTIPLFHSWIDASYPGTKLAIGEYNWGGLESINGALAEADVLGIFGRERVDLAAMWDPPSANQPGAYASASIAITMATAHRSAICRCSPRAAIRGNWRSTARNGAAIGRSPLMVINKTGTDLSSPLSLTGVTPLGSAQVYRYSGANLNAIVRQPDAPMTPGA